MLPLTPRADQSQARSFGLLLLDLAAAREYGNSLRGGPQIPCAPGTCTVRNFNTRYTMTVSRRRFLLTSATALGGLANGTLGRAAEGANARLYDSTLDIYQIALRLGLGI